MSLREKITEVITKYLLNKEEIIFAYIFGSFEETENYNDIDIAIYLESEFEQPQGYDLRLAVELETKLDKKIDIIIINQASPSLIFEISKGKLLFDKDENLRTDFLTLNWKLYWDYKEKKMNLLRELYA